MKVGIVTLFDLHNVGNRLQNYAVTSVLHKLGFSCETLVPRRLAKTPYRLKLDKIVGELLETDVRRAQEEYPKMCKALRFEKFTDEYIPYRELSVRQFSEQQAKQYDFFVTGSDQVWNPIFRSSVGQVENHLLAFAPAEKRVAFSPSIGVDDIPIHWYPLYEEELSKYRCLSVREQTGADLIKKLTGKDAMVMVDPTMLIDREEWLSLAKPLPCFDYQKEYILLYFLGEPDDEMSVELREFLEHQKKRGVECVRLFDENNPHMMSVGPAEILHLFKHAKMICTDSFHGTVFSLLLGKPFLLADRKLIMRNMEIDMSARIHTLLKKLLLEEKLPQNQLWDENSIWNCDYERAYKQLLCERESAMKFLRKSFCMEE